MHSAKRELSEMIQTQKAIKHLGILSDTKSFFWEQMQRAANKAVEVTMGLSELMANVGCRKLTTVQKYGHCA